MREPRVLLAVCTYDEMVLCLSDCDNDELQKICETVYANNQEGIGKYWYEVAEELYPECYFKQLVDNGGPTDHYILNELITENIAHCEDITISAVISTVEELNDWTRNIR
ncbi:MAG: hypothetical protein E7272_07505 [Pseudobutyrivibrio ruminis]|uniref:Uncharacterized protein n=1 Tax=Pseudobutyrivibrio ruminis TaxID=46206 RepID=A0A927UD31_9FIRM|nr:hypothetical protein [Pseudobutyrivibrio ruminis]